MNWKSKFINEFDGKGKVFSALLGVLTLFAVLGEIVPGWYSLLPEYTEWICGVTTWSAYNKQADMRLIQTCILALPLLFLLFGVIYVGWNRRFRENARQSGIVCGISYVTVLCMFYVDSPNAGSCLLLWGILTIGYVILGKQNRTETYTDIVVTGLIVSLALTSLCLLLSGIFAKGAGIWQKYSVAVPVTAGVVFLGLIFWKKSERLYKRLWDLQLLLPVAMIGCIHFRYRYEKDGALMELFYSGRWKWFCILLCVLLLVLGFIEKKKTGHTVYFSTFVMTAVLRVFSQPEGMVNIDYFHNGEITMPMQQLMSYGKLPYADLIPIHGLCDYYYGLMSYLFFDGSYLSLNAAKIVGDLAMAFMLAAVIYFFVQKKMHGLLMVYGFMPFMIKTAGMRYFFLFMMFFVLLSPYMKKGMQSLYAWILLSIAAIAWNASIGGAAALAFLPVILYRGKRDVAVQLREFVYSRDKTKCNLTWVAWGLLFITGVAFIPLFLQIVVYLKENTGTTLYVNGMEMLEDTTATAEYLVPGLVNGQGAFFLTTFAFLIPLLLAFILMFCKEKTGAGEFFVTYLLAFWVLSNYSFVRYDEGGRAKVLGVFFLMFTASSLLFPLLKANHEKRKTDALALYTAVIGLAVLMAGDSPVMTAETLVLEKEVPQSVETTIMGQVVEDPVVHVSGELVSIPKLGTGFIQGNTLASLQNVLKVIQAAQQKELTVFDTTNAVANAVIFDLPMYLPYSSAYNISNDVMQEKAIALLEKKLPDVIIAAPEIRFDDAPFSFRSMKLYRYLMEQEYVPYKYANVIYLVHGENPLPEAEQNMEAFAQLMHKKDLAYLPAVWAANRETITKNLNEPLQEIEIAAEIESVEGGYKMVFDAPISGRDISMISVSGIHFSEEKGRTDEIQGRTVNPKMTMTINSSIATEGKAEFSFGLKGEEYLIPVCCSPYFTEEDKIEYLELTTENAEGIIPEQLKIRFYQ